MTDAYGAPDPWSETPQRAPAKATAALIVAVAGLLVCGPVAGVVALILASQAGREIRESGGRLGGEGTVTTARILAIIDIALAVVLVIAFVVVDGLGEL